MFVEILLAILAGVTAGTFTGLTPGLHVNLVSLFVVSFAFTSFALSPFLVFIFIISLALTHSFLDSIPTVFLGAPDPGMVVGILPAHQLFLLGKGHLAVLYTLFGSYFSLLFALLLAPLAYLGLQPLSDVLSPYIGKILLGLVLLLCLFSKKFVNVLFFLLSGVLGFISFELSMDQVLLPLLSGLFGLSTLLFALISPSTVVKQHISYSNVIGYWQVESTSFLATITGFFAAFLPGFGSSQGAIFASLALNEKSPQNYLLLVGGINTVNFVLSLLTFALLFKARNGAIASISSYVQLELQHFFLLVPLLLIVGGLATILGIFLSKRFASLISVLPYKKIIVGVIVFLVVLTIFFTGLKGIILLLTATALGILAQAYGASKNMMLGCLLLPVIFYLW